MQYTYYYLSDLGEDYIVTGIAKGGSRAGCVSTFCSKSDMLKDLGIKPLLFNTQMDAYAAALGRKNKATQGIEWCVRSITLDFPITI